MTDDNQGARYIIQSHGLANHTPVPHSTSVSSHWIRSCLEVYFLFFFLCFKLYICLFIMNYIYIDLIKNNIFDLKTTLGGVHTRCF